MSNQELYIFLEDYDWFLAKVLRRWKFEQRCSMYKTLDTPSNRDSLIHQLLSIVVDVIARHGLFPIPNDILTIDFDSMCIDINPKYRLRFMEDVVEIIEVTED